MTSYFLTVFLSYLLIYKYLALIVYVFLAAFILPLPLNAAFVALGAFASQGYFNVFVVWIAAFSTNVSADIIGYYITNKYGESIFRKLHINAQSAKFLKIEKWLREYAGETIFFTRITSPFASIVNFISGFIGVPFKKFILADLAGNFIDIVFCVFAGYFLGNYWEEFLINVQYIGIAIFIIFVLSLLVRIYGKKYFKFFKRK